MENKRFPAISLRLDPNPKSFSVPSAVKQVTGGFLHPKVGLADHIAFYEVGPANPAASLDIFLEL